MGGDSSCVAIYGDHEGVEAALGLLEKGSVECRNISVIASAEEAPDCSVGLAMTGERVVLRGRQSSFWGGVRQRLPEISLFVIPAVGSIVVAGALGAVLVTVLEEVLNGLNIFRVTLSRVGVPSESVIAYENAIKEGAYLLIVQGDVREAERTHNLLLSGGARDMAIHFS